MHTQSKYRLLVVRLGAMGDILHALPAVTALRQAHPEWVIDWVVEPRWRALLTADVAAKENLFSNTGRGNPPTTVKDAAERSNAAGLVEGLVSGHDFSRAETGPDFTRALAPEVRSSPVSSPSESFPAASTASFPPRGRTPARPVVDSLHLAPTRDWRDAPLSRKTFHEIKSLRQALRAGDYDTVIDLQGAVRSAVVGRMASCQRLIGEAEPRERAARWLFTERIETRGAHVIEQDVELASAVAGDDLKPAAPWLPVDPAAEAWVDSVFPLNSKSSAVLINPGAGWGAKRWPVECFAEIAGGLLERGLRVLVNAGPGEEPLADGIARATGGRAETIVPTLGQLISLTRRIALCVAGDTGPLHLACALGRPVVGIYGPTDPSRNGPFGTRFRVLRSPDSRRDHTRHATPEAGLMTILPEHVLQAADELLAEDENQ